MLQRKVKIKVKVKLVRSSRYEEIMGSWCISPPFLTSVLGEGEWSAPRTSRINPQEKPRVSVAYETVWIVWKKNILPLTGIEFDPPSVEEWLYRLSNSNSSTLKCTQLKLYEMVEVTVLNYRRENWTRFDRMNNRSGVSVEMKCLRKLTRFPSLDFKRKMQICGNNHMSVIWMRKQENKGKKRTQIEL